MAHVAGLLKHGPRYTVLTGYTFKLPVWGVPLHDDDDVCLANNKLRGQSTEYGKFNCRAVCWISHDLECFIGNGLTC